MLAGLNRLTIKIQASRIKKMHSKVIAHSAMVENGGIVRRLWRPSEYLEATKSEERGNVTKGNFSLPPKTRYLWNSTSAIKRGTERESR